ncbi:MAG TPA: AMP-binding protein [Candidatus Elarobacter sp.]|nr:AMP-binding protein [Candidatus Elarobacter sp.]
MPLRQYPERVTDDLIRWARAKPDAVFLAERRGETWETITFGAMLQRVRRIGAALLAAGGSHERPLAIVAENGIDHATIVLAAMYAGIPASPISTGYVRPDADPARLQALLGVLQPFAAFVPDAAYADRFAATAPALHLFKDASALAGDNASALADHGASNGDRPATRDPSAADRAHAALGGDSVAKILFTSGSTGTPKGVMITHRMLCANQTMLEQVWPDAIRDPVLVDWAPWSHVAAGNKNFGLVLRNGGTMFVDAGKPAPGAFDTTLRNLREIAPTFYFNVPRGWALLFEALESDDALATTFFSRLRILLNAGASIPESLRARLNALAQRYAGHDVPVVSAWGLTETAPMATAVWGERPAERETIGTPVPGVEIKLAPVEDRYELRVRGPSVTPGYWRNAEATAAAFDEDGFFKTGDAGALLDESDPSRGIVFGGRLAENFKLSSGTWVNAGLLRLDVIEAGEGTIEDVVFAGADRDELTAIVFVPRALANDPAIRERVRAALARHNECNPASSTRVARALIAAEPPNGAHGEITDKGSVNQRRVLQNRAADVARLYAEPRGSAIIVP